MIRIKLSKASWREEKKSRLHEHTSCFSPVNYRSFPVLRTINFADPADKARHDRMVALVTQMLDLNKKVQDARLEQEKTALSRQIEATDAAIDKLVYVLYGLTEEEIKIVEGAGK